MEIGGDRCSSHLMMRILRISATRSEARRLRVLVVVVVWTGGVVIRCGNV